MWTGIQMSYTVSVIYTDVFKQLVCMLVIPNGKMKTPFLTYKLLLFKLYFLSFLAFYEK